MHVAIDLFIAEKEPGDMLFATRALLDGLSRIDRANEYSIITSRPKEYQALALAPNMHIYPVKLHSWHGILIQHQLHLPQIVRQIQPDVLHVPAFAAPIGWNGPMVMTVHGLGFLGMPRQTSLYAQLYWRYMLRESVRRAQRIIVSSEQTREELASYWSVERERIRLIHNALRPSLRSDRISTEEIQAMRNRVGGNYLLHAGRIMPSKNVETLVKAFELLAPRFEDLSLVLTGGLGYGSAGIIQQIETSSYRRRIHLIDWVSEEQLGPLYAGASALVFPSRHENFGLPTVEAMACGTPVVASPEAASVEIAGEAVLRTDCSNPTHLADAITQVLLDEALRKRLIQFGHVQAKSFTSEACAHMTLQIYQEALALSTQGRSLQKSNERLTIHTHS